MGYHGRPSDVAEMVAFLASNAGRYMTGATLVLDDASHFTGTVTGFGFGDTIDLVGIAPANVSVTNSGSLHVSYGTGSFNLVGNYDPAGFPIASDGGTGTHLTWNHQAPVIVTNNLTTVQNGDGSTTVLGVQVTDSDGSASTETFNLTATTGAAASGTSITPSSDSGLLTHINGTFTSGVTYLPGGTPPTTDKVTLTVTDSFGASDTVNFVFNQAGSGPNIVLQGTSGKDVVFATSGQDVLTVGKFEMPSRAYLGRFNFKGADQQKVVGQLSGGERGRLHLAKTLLRGGNVLLLDEPSNDLDVETLRALEDALLEFPGCVMVISHDRWFLDRIASHILACEGESQWNFFPGNYQEYEEDKKKRLGEEGAAPHRIRFKPLKG